MLRRRAPGRATVMPWYFDGCRTYQCGELLAERRRLMDDWTRLCAGEAVGEGENVVALRG